MLDTFLNDSPYYYLVRQGLSFNSDMAISASLVRLRISLLPPEH